MAALCVLTDSRASVRCCLLAWASAGSAMNAWAAEGGRRERSARSSLAAVSCWWYLHPMCGAQHRSLDTQKT